MLVVSALLETALLLSLNVEARGSLPQARELLFFVLSVRTQLVA